MSESNEVTREELAEAIHGWRVNSPLSWAFIGETADWLRDSFVITRKPEPLPSEPGWYIDCDEDVWRLNTDGWSHRNYPYRAEDVVPHAPFRRLVVAE